MTCSKLRNQYYVLFLLPNKVGANGNEKLKVQENRGISICVRVYLFSEEEGKGASRFANQLP